MSDDELEAEDRHDEIVQLRSELATLKAERDRLKELMRRCVDALEQVVRLSNTNKGTLDIIHGVAVRLNDAAKAQGGEE